MPLNAKKQLLHVVLPLILFFISALLRGLILMLTGLVLVRKGGAK